MMLDISEEVHLVKKLIENKYPKHNKNKFLLINLNNQLLTLIIDLKEINSYDISSSKFGTGNLSNSYQTPLGLHRINDKIGENKPINTIFKGRKIVEGGITIEDLSKPEFKNFKNKHFEEFDDLITSRILWLKGCEEGINLGDNIDTYKRFIYIHGTAHEELIGQVASYGCIRMRNRDVIELFDSVDKGTFVYIYDKKVNL